jgi:hypothetical protein
MAEPSANRLASAQAAVPFPLRRRVKYSPRPDRIPRVKDSLGYPCFEPVKETLIRQSWQWFGRPVAASIPFRFCTGRAGREVFNNLCATQRTPPPGDPRRRKEPTTPRGRHRRSRAPRGCGPRVRAPIPRSTPRRPAHSRRRLRTRFRPKPGADAVAAARAAEAAEATRKADQARLRPKTTTSMPAVLETAQCIAYARRTKHPEFKDRTVWDVFQEERASLMELRGPFDGFVEKAVRASTTCLTPCISDRPHRGANTRLPTSFAELDRGTNGSLIPCVPDGSERLKACVSPP